MSIQAMPASTAHRAARRARRLVRAAGALLAAVLAGCGGGHADRSVPLPLGEGHPTAYTEQYLANHPEALVQPGHVVVLHHEAASDGADDTGGEQGVDEIAYHVPTAMRVTLKVDPDSDTISHVVLRDDNGRELGRHHRETEAHRTVDLQPGRHVLEVHHAAKGDRSAGARAVFLRLAEAGTPVAGAGTRALAAAAAPRATATAAAAIVASASRSCLNCVFDNSDMSGSNVYAGADMSGSRFTNTRLSGASMTQIVCVACMFTGSTLVGTDFSGSRMDGSSFTNADTRAMSITPGGGVGASCVGCSFTGPAMDNMHLWGADLRNTTIQFTNASIFVIDLSWSDCSGCDISSYTVVNNVITDTTLSTLHLQGARLQNAKLHFLNVLTGNFHQAALDGASFYVFTCTTCNFPGAMARNARFEFTVIETGLWDDADLSGSTVVSPSAALAEAGSFARAKLNNMTPAGYLATQTHAFCCLPSQLLDFRGTQFVGMDLSGADFSVAKAVVDSSTNFSGATLSNGTAGISLAGQNLSGSTTLAGHDLRHADLSSTTLVDTDLGQTDFSGAVLRGAKLAGSNLKAARLAGAQLGVGSTSEGIAADLTDTFIAGTDFSDADLRSVVLSKARAFGGASFRRARLDAALLAGAMLAEADFGSASLTGTTFTGAWLVNASFIGASMQRTRLDGAWLLGTGIDGALSVDGLSLDDASVSVNNGAWTYTEQDGSLKTYAYPPAALGVIATSATTVSCPNRQRGPCNTPTSLAPSNGSPFPPKPACTTDWRGNTTCK